MDSTADNAEENAIAPRVVTDERELVSVAESLRGAERIAMDLESDGLFAYRASVCVVQLAHAGGTIIVDSRVTSIAPLADLLGVRGPIKVVHDVAFDARLLAENGIALGNCHDTSICAQMLGRKATGLAALLLSELEIRVDKSMQHHDWRIRPFDAKAIRYLAGDVAHLEALDDVLFTAARAAGIEDEVREETVYRLANAVASAQAIDPRPAYVRMRGIERASENELAVMREIAELREKEAARADVPPHKIITNEAIAAIAAARPKTLDELRKIRGAMSGRAGAIARDVLAAVTTGATRAKIPDAERVFFERPRIPAAIAKERRTREARLTAWRREEAKRRGVDEQAVLPGHCLRAIAERTIATPIDLRDVPGIGEFRIARDGEAILRALTTPREEAPAPKDTGDA